MRKASYKAYDGKGLRFTEGIKLLDLALEKEAKWDQDCEIGREQFYFFTSRGSSKAALMPFNLT